MGCIFGKLFQVFKIGCNDFVFGFQLAGLRLNRSLLLLSRIENGQFPLNEDIDFSLLVRNQLDWVAELVEARDISLTVEVDDSVHQTTHHMLAEALVGNLVKNAIRHNVDSGNIAIHLSNEGLEVSNTGQPLEVAPESLFERFAKADVTSTGSGLGLAIIKQVCDANNWDVHYLFEGDRHTLRVNFAAASAA